VENVASTLFEDDTPHAKQYLWKTGKFVVVVVVFICSSCCMFTCWLTFVDDFVALVGFVWTQTLANSIAFFQILFSIFC
jgi:hypothetical protein